MGTLAETELAEHPAKDNCIRCSQWSKTTNLTEEQKEHAASCAVIKGHEVCKVLKQRFCHSLAGHAFVVLSCWAMEQRELQRATLCQKIGRCDLAHTGCTQREVISHDQHSLSPKPVWLTGFRHDFLDEMRSGKFSRARLARNHGLFGRNEKRKTKIRTTQHFEAERKKECIYVYMQHSSLIRAS
jgi:ribosomal protein L35